MSSFCQGFLEAAWDHFMNRRTLLRLTSILSFFITKYTQYFKPTSQFRLKTLLSLLIHKQQPSHVFRLVVPSQSHSTQLLPLKSRTTRSSMQVEPPASRYSLTGMCFSINSERVFMWLQLVNFFPQVFSSLSPVESPTVSVALGNLFLE